MSPTILPLELGDIFSRTFDLTRKTFVRNIMIGLLLLVPAALLFTIGMSAFYSSIADLAQGGGIDRTADAVDILFTLLGTFAFVGFGYIVLMVAYTIARLAAINVVCSEVMEQPASWQAALREVFDLRVLRAIGQTILEYCAYIGIILIPYVLIIAGAAARSPILILVAVLLLLASFVAVLYFAVRWAFTLPIIAWEDERIIESFRRSGELVHGVWWRTFGILILFSVVVGFAVSLITAPLIFAGMWGFLKDYYEVLSQSGSPAVAGESATQLLSSMGIGMGIAICLQMLIMMLIQPTYISVMYFDLRARNGEFGTHEESSSTPEPLPLF